MLRGYIAAALLAAALLVGCGAAAGPSGLAGTRWELERVGAGAARPAPEPLTLEFDDSGRAAGNGGCNRYSGSFTQGGPALTFGAMISTKRACVDADLMAQEQAFLGALSGVAGYRISGDQLVLLDANGADVLVFRRA
jgi:putative lipoprotein